MIIMYEAKVSRMKAALWWVPLRLQVVKNGENLRSKSIQRKENN